MDKITLIDITGRGSQYLNLAHVRLLEVRRYGDETIGLSVTYSDASEDTFVLSAGRYCVVEDAISDLVAS